MKLSVFGAGYVGLVSAVCLAKIGHQVICIDTDHEKIALLQQGISPIYEQGLQVLLPPLLSKGLLAFSTSAQVALQEPEAVMIAVGTPLTADNDIDLRYVEQVVNTIAHHIEHDVLIIIKSTVIPGTQQRLSEQLQDILGQRKVNIDVDVVNNPEFLQEGSAMQQFMNPDRIIIGAEKSKSINVLKKIYQPLVKDQSQVLVMSPESAELAKYASNAMLATKISFINEISQIAAAVGADMESVKTAVGADYRISPYFLNAGCGFGGSCFPKDMMTLVASAKRLGVKPLLLESVLQRNALQQSDLFYRVQRFFNADLAGKTIALWGASFKPHTDDVRCATSHVVANLFWQAGCHIKLHDPLAMNNFASAHKDQKALTLCDSPLAALQQADVLVITTEWPEFKAISPSIIKKQLRHTAVFDGRGLFDAKEMQQQGIYYQSITA